MPKRLIPAVSIQPFQPSEPHLEGPEDPKARKPLPEPTVTWVDPETMEVHRALGASDSGDEAIDTDCDEITALRWVAANVGRSPRKADAPSHAAWNLLASVQEDPDIRKAFWNRHMALAQKQDDGSADTLGQTGRFCRKLLDQMIAECLPADEDEL